MRAAHVAAVFAVIVSIFAASPRIADAQCIRERFGALASGPNHKFAFKGDVTLVFANLNPIVDGVTINLNGTPVTVPPGAHGGAGTAGWVNHAGGNAWSYKDSDHVNPKIKAKIIDRDGDIDFIFGMAKTSLGFLIGSVGPNTTPTISFDASGEGCASDFLNDEMNMIADCVDTGDPTKISCKSLD